MKTTTIGYWFRFHVNTATSWRERVGNLLRRAAGLPQADRRLRHRHRPAAEEHHPPALDRSGSCPRRATRPSNKMQNMTREEMDSPEIREQVTKLLTDYWVPKLTSSPGFLILALDPDEDGAVLSSAKLGLNDLERFHDAFHNLADTLVTRYLENEAKVVAEQMLANASTKH